MDLHKLEGAWEEVINNHFDLVVNKSNEKGIGIGLFNFVKSSPTHSVSVQFCYSCLSDVEFGEILNKLSKNVMEKYNPQTHILICIQIPCEGGTTGAMRLFNKITKEEVFA